MNEWEKEGIGPHELRELELMLAGRKPLAVFCDGVPASFELPEKDFAPHVASGRIIRREEIYLDPRADYPGRFVYYALPEEAWRIEALHRINEAIFTGRRKATEQNDIETGRLLGYAEEDIQRFLDHARQYTGDQGSVEATRKPRKTGRLPSTSPSR